MPDIVTVYFDYYSPYAYFVSETLDAALIPYNLDAEWKPVDVVALLGLARADCYVPAKRKYVNHDVLRCAEFYGVPLAVPKPWPLSSQLALRVSVLIGAQPYFTAFRRRVFRAAWAQQCDIADADVLRACLTESGGDPHTVAAAQTAEVDAQLAALTECAQREHVFGVPLMQYRNEFFFGRDRLDMLLWRVRAERIRHSAEIA